MESQALEILQRFGKLVRYSPKLGGTKLLTAHIEPIRRTDELGNQSFLTKTYEVWIVRDPVEGLMTITPNADVIAFKLYPNERQDTILTITKIYPDSDSGISGDPVGMWHLEAVA